MTSDQSTQDFQQPVLRDLHLEGQRVLVRPMRPEDAPLAFRLLHGCDQVLDWLIWNGPNSEEELAASYSQWIDGGAAGRSYRLALVDLDSGQFVGSLAARFAGHPFNCDYGYWLAPQAWGKGIASEAVQLMSGVCFDELRSSCLYAKTYAGNHGSRIVLERTGFHFDCEQSGQVNGEKRREWYFSLTQREWARRVATQGTLRNERCRVEVSFDS